MPKDMTRTLDGLGDKLGDITTAAHNLGEDIATLAAELDTPLSAGILDDSRQSLTAINDTVSTIRKELWGINNGIDDLEDQLVVYDTDNRDLRDAIDRMSVAVIAGDLRHELRGRVMTARDGAAGLGDVVAWVDAALGVFADIADIAEVDGNDAARLINGTIRLEVVA